MCLSAARATVIDFPVSSRVAHIASPVVPPVTPELAPCRYGSMHSISSEIDSILREEIELAQKDDPALIVRSAFEVIEDFLSQGMSLERIAAALQKNDIKVTKGHLVRHLGIVREERGLKPLKRGRKLKTIATQTATEIGLTRSPTELNQPACPDARHVGKEKTHNKAKRTSASQSQFPDAIIKLKFIEINGELVDITKMNIDDYLIVSKTLPENGKIPAGMFEVVAAENRIRGMYERALSQYDEAIAKWKSGQ